MDQLYTRWSSFIQQDAKRGDFNGKEGKWTAYVATAVDEYSEGGSDQSLFTVSEEQTTAENCCIHRDYRRRRRRRKKKLQTT